MSNQINILIPDAIDISALDYTMNLFDFTANCAIFFIITQIFTTYKKFVETNDDEIRIIYAVKLNNLLKFFNIVANINLVILLRNLGSLVKGSTDIKDIITNVFKYLLTHGIFNLIFGIILPKQLVNFINDDVINYKKLYVYLFLIFIKCILEFVRHIYLYTNFIRKI